MTNDECLPRPAAVSGLGICASSFTRHSSFVIRHFIISCLLLGSVALAQNSPRIGYVFPAGTVLRHGSDEQKRTWLPQVADGRKRLGD